MTIQKCKSIDGHYFNKKNICVRCDLDYNDVIKAEKQMKKSLALIADAKRVLKIKI